MRPFWLALACVACQRGELGPERALVRGATVLSAVESSVGGPSAPAQVPDRATAERCPAGMALVAGRFCIDRFEASTVDPAGAPHSPYHAVGPLAVRAVSEPGALPQAYISMEESDQACTRAGKRLCTTQQWLDACSGTTRAPRTYPYGERLLPRACNVDHTGHPQLALLHGRRKTDSWNLNDPRLDQLGGTLAPGGAFEHCVTPEGVHDLVGNLLEWTRGERPLLMGGHFVESHENGEGCRYVTMRHDAQYHDFTTGFRCCGAPLAESAASERAASESAAIHVAAPPVASAPVAVAATPGAWPALPTEREPAGFRSFVDPAARLPAFDASPARAPGAPCAPDMVAVSGSRCANPVQECLRWGDDEGKPQRSCAEFAPTVCQGARVRLDFCIDRYEATPPGWSVPLVHVSWQEASNVCHSLDKRLCYEDEWELACEGEAALPYPYGNVRDGATCNHDRDGLFTDRGKLIDQRVGSASLTACVSPYGVVGLVGNVDEWTTRREAQAPWRSILRGGWWLKGRNRCRAATSSHKESYAGPQTGFRCCTAQAAR